MEEFIVVLADIYWGFSRGFPGGSVVKKKTTKTHTCSTGDMGSVPELGRSPGKGNGNPLQSSCLENSIDRGAWRATVHGMSKSWT